mmetsp:Transcript_28871/g.73685  ORF Transcript_28871/g.73685 Transcript_28871/m.73685 type:complete len:153 (+) Transcript_28871:83-541(+)
MPPKKPVAAKPSSKQQSSSSKKEQNSKTPKPGVISIASGTKVTNIVGSSESNTKAKAFYTKVTGSWPDRCCAQGCTNPAQHGGHVKVSGHGLITWYIIPVCQNPHNLPASDTTFLVKKTKAVEDDIKFTERAASWKHSIAKVANDLMKKLSV